MFTAQALRDQFSTLIEEVFGPLTLPIEGVSPAEDPQAKSMVFAQDEKNLKTALNSQVSCIVTSKGLKKYIPAQPKQAVFVTSNLPMAQAKFSQHLMGRYPTQDQAKPGIHATAIISPKTKLPASCHVGPYVVIGENVEVGENCYFGAHTVIEDRVKIGKNTKLWAHVVIASDSILGEDCVVHPHTTIGSEGYGFAHDEKGNHHRIPQLGNVIIGNRVELGSHCSVDRSTYGSTRIGDGTKADNYVHIAHNCSVGKNCILTFGLGMAGSSHLGDFVVTGGRANITDHVSVTSGVRLGGLSGVSKDITEPGDYGGYPLQKLKDYLRTTASLPHLPTMRKELARILELLSKDKAL